MERARGAWRSTLLIRSIRAAKTLAAAFAILYVFYAVGAWLFLSTPQFERHVALDPEDGSITIERGWSWIPGEVEVVGGRVEILDEDVDVVVSIPRASVSVSLWKLWFRELHITRLETPDSGSAVDAVAAEIRLAHRQSRVPDPPRPADAPDPWKIEIEGVKLGRIAELRVDDWTYRGHARAQGGFRMQPGREAEVYDSRLELVHGGVDGFAHPWTGAIDVRLHPHSLPDVDGMETFRYLDARVRADARVRHVRFLNLLLRSTRHVEIAGGSGDLLADVSLRKGVLSDGTRFDLSSRDLALRVRSHLFSGSGLVRGTVQGNRGRLDLGLHSLRVERRIGRRVSLVGDAGALRSWLETDSLDLSASPFESFVAGLSLERSHVRLERLSHLLPGAIRFVRGMGEVELNLSAFSGPERSRGEGRLRAELSDAQGSLGSFDFAGANRATIAAEVAPIDLNRDELTLSQVALAFRGLDFAARGAPAVTPGWWIETRSPSMRVRIGEIAPRFTAELGMTLRDAQPLLSWLEARDDLPFWAKPLISGGPLHARGNVDAGASRLTLRDLSAEIEGGLRAEGNLLRAGERTEGAFVARLGPLSVGVRMRPEGARIKLFAGDDWLEQQVAQLERPRQAGGRAGR